MDIDNYRQNFIKNNNLQEITFSISDQVNYPYYDDGSTYYRDPQGVIYRITVAEIFIYRGLDDESLVEQF